MRKALCIFALIILLALALGSNFALAADDYWTTTGTKRDSTFVQRGDQHYTIFLRDTCTIAFLAVGRDTVIDLGQFYYNFWIRSLNGVADSGYAKISFSQNGGKGIWHADSVARNLQFATIGLATGGAAPSNDYLIAPIGARYVYVRGIKGGTADTTITLEIGAMR